MRDKFWGRSEELAWLRGQFEACATRDSDGSFPGPRMALVVAESGLGKSRLVQEMYVRLTSDPRWDPPEVDYWPDAFQASGEELRVVPDMTGHRAMGPPRFAWLGARWHDPRERNRTSRSSILPELRSSLMVHAEIHRDHQSMWADAAAKATDAARNHGMGELTGQVVDYALQSVPFGGLLFKLGSGAIGFARDRMAGPSSVEEETKKDRSSDAAEVLECFRLLLAARSAVPVILWLDDAQWIDDDTLSFLRQLWAEAQRRRWPLFVVATHWEREWRELALGPAGAHPWSFALPSDVATITLDHAPDAVLSQCLHDRLPGLTADQRAMMIEKASGNFLQLHENIGELVMEPMNFVGGRTDGPLTDEAMGHIRTWKCEREERVEQRFRALEDDTRKVLGWSSQLGTRFLREVVEGFARERLNRDDTSAIVDRCVDPYVVLDRSSKLTREFRDRAYYRVAGDFRRRFLKDDAERLTALLRAHLIALITATIDADGEIRPPVPDATPVPGLMGLASDERREVLDMALQYLRWEGEPNWTNDEYRAAFQATCLAIEADAAERLWGRVQSHLGRLQWVRWEDLPQAICGVALRKMIVDAAVECGRWKLAEPIAISLVEVAWKLLAQQETPERLRVVGLSLGRIGDVTAARGQLDDALQHYQQCLQIARRLLWMEETPQRLRDVSLFLGRIGDVARARGQLDDALQHYEEGLQIDRRLLGMEETPERLRVVSLSLERIGDVADTRGQIDDALRHYDQCLQIARRLLGMEETPERLRDVSLSLGRIGDVARARGQLDDALQHYDQCLQITRRLLGMEETPERLRDVSLFLGRIGDVARARGQLDDAIQHYEEGLQIDRRLLGIEETPERLRAVSLPLERIGDVARDRGQLDDALQHYEQCLQIDRRLLGMEETPERLRNVSLSLGRIGDVAEARGHLDDALQHYEEGLQIDRRLLGMEETPERLRDLSISLGRIGDVASARGHLGDALRHYEEALQIAGKVNDTAADMNWTVWLAHLLGSHLAGVSRHVDAFDVATRYLDHARSLESEAGDDANILDTCAAFWESRASAAETCGEIDAAVEAAAHADALRARITTLPE